MSCDSLAHKSRAAAQSIGAPDIQATRGGPEKCPDCGRFVNVDRECAKCDLDRNLTINDDGEGGLIYGYNITRWDIDSHAKVVQFEINGVTVAMVEPMRTGVGPDGGSVYSQPSYKVPYGWGKPTELHAADHIEDDGDETGFYWLSFDSFSKAKAWAVELSQTEIRPDHTDEDGVVWRYSLNGGRVCSDCGCEPDRAPDTASLPYRPDFGRDADTPPATDHYAYCTFSRREK